MKNINQVLTSKTPKVYKNKQLNTANFGDFTLNDYQVFLYLISKIGGVDELGKYLQHGKLEREYILTAKEFVQVFNTEISNAYKLLSKACKKLMKTSIILQKIELKEIWEINICSTAKYNKSQGSITIKFTDDIMPYLVQVRQKFMLYNLKEVSRFKSLYSTRLYELIQEFKETGWLLKTIAQLKEIFAVGNKFKLYGHFKDKIIMHACREINDNYDMGLCFEEVKEGKKVVAIKFFFKQTIANQITNKKTGKETIIYEKPKTKPNVSIRKRTKNQNEEIAIGQQLSFLEQQQEAKPVKSILSSILSKFKSSKK